MDRSFLFHGGDNCHKKLISAVIFALNFLSKVIIRKTNVLTHFTVIIHQTKKAAIYINELEGGEGEERKGKKGGEEERRMEGRRGKGREEEGSEKRREQGGEKIGGKIRERDKIKVCQTKYE